MIKPLILILLTCWSLLTSAQSTWTGNWEGRINGIVSLRIGFDFKGTGDQPAVTMNSPDQGAYGLPVEVTYISKDSVFLSMKKFGIAYSGKRSTDSTIDGYFIQGGMVPLQLKKLLKVTVLPRPQNPAPPFPYTSQEVEFYNHDIKLSGTLTVPKSSNSKIKETYPALLLISGSGPQNRDEEIMGHRPFAVLADYLSRRGFIVLRVDDRGTGKSTGEFKNATSLDFASDADAAVQFMATCPEADTTRLGLLGHSEGGLIAPLVAVSRHDIDFIILLAAPGIKSTILMREQNEAILSSNGLSKEAVTAYGKLYSQITFAIVSSNETGDAAAEKVMQDWISEVSPAIQTELSLAHPSDQEKFVRDFVDIFGNPWFRYFMRYDPQPVLEKLHTKVLALNGEKDIQVLSQSNLSGIKAGLSRSKSDFEVHEMKGLNHLFQHCTKCTVKEYGLLEETIAPEVLSLIGDWLLKKVQK